VLLKGGKVPPKGVLLVEHLQARHEHIVVLELFPLCLQELRQLPLLVLDLCNALQARGEKVADGGHVVREEAQRTAPLDGAKCLERGCRRGSQPCCTFALSVQCLKAVGLESPRRKEVKSLPVRTTWPISRKRMATGIARRGRECVCVSACVSEKRGRPVMRKRKTKDRQGSAVAPSRCSSECKRWCTVFTTESM